MTVREYIGARYVPLFVGTWNINNTYEPLSIVEYQGNSFTSRQYVPANVDINNTAYWALTGNYNAQIEQYREEVAQIATRITNFEDDLPSSEFDPQNTVKDYVDAVDAKLGSGFDAQNTVKDYVDDVDDKLGNGFDAENTVKDYIDDVNVKLGNGFDAENTVKDYIDTSINDLYLNYETHFIGRVFTGAFSGQSCCSDGDYLYLFATSSDDTQTNIYKYDLSTGLQVATRTIAGGHFNSAIYDSDSASIYVGSYTNILKINPDSLYVVDTIPTTFSAPNITIDPITNKKYVCDMNSYPIATVYECDWTVDVSQKTQLFTFNATIPIKYNYYGTDVLATQNMSVYNGEFFYAASTVNNFALEHIKVQNNIGTIDYIISPNTDSQLYSVYEMQAGYFTEWGEYIFCSYARLLNAYNVNISTIFAVPIYGCKTTNTVVDDYRADIHFDNTGGDVYLNPFKVTINYATVFQNITEAIMLATIAKKPLHIDSNITAEAYYLNNTDINLVIESGAIFKLMNTINNCRMLINGTGTLDFNSKWITGCDMKIVGVNVTGTANLSGSEINFANIGANSNAKVDCRNYGFVTGAASDLSKLTLSNKTEIYGTVV